MKRHISFPEIEQFRSVVHNVKHKTSYCGKDADGNAIHDYNIPCPVLKFMGTVKLHGTNSAVVRDENEMWVQSRENLIEPGKDNAGFAMWVHSKQETFNKLFASCYRHINCDKTIPLTAFPTVAIYGEWCGAGIQKNMAISSLPKMFVIFSIAIVNTTINSEGITCNNKTWLTKEQIGKIYTDSNTSDVLRTIFDFPHWYIDIDFNKPQEYQNQLTDMTLAVEAECPVGKQLGAIGIGEGIVWKCITEPFLDSGFWFKVKGEKHSKTKVKTLAPVDVEKINSINLLAEKLTPEWRLEQMCSKTFDILNGGKLDIKGMGEFIKNTMADILKEEIDTVAASGFNTKEITSPISKRCREYLTEQLKDFSK